MLPNVPLSRGHQVIDITNGHFIHAIPLAGTRVSIYLYQCYACVFCIVAL